MSATRVEYSAEVLSGERGGVVLAPDLEAAYAFINDYAAEHLMIQSDEPFAHLRKIKHAGEILLGNRTSNTLANFVIGPNNVLPTNGAARTMSPLSVHDFGKRSTVAHVTSVGYAELAQHARILATYEGFDGHANAVSETRDRLMGN
jgi:histidinol dehydrogenase